MAVLISFAGLPGAGKSTIAKELSRRTAAVYLRVDEIEAAIWALAPERDIGSEGYHIAAALAASNLDLGRSAIVDCVNPWAVTREIFAGAAARARAELLGVEVICSDLATHRRRVETRESEVPGLAPPDWPKVLARDYAPWREADLRIDTADTGVADAVSRILARL